jgi:hypothetical protein
LGSRSFLSLHSETSPASFTDKEFPSLELIYRVRARSRFRLPRSVQEPLSLTELLDQSWLASWLLRSLGAWLPFGLPRGA